MPGIKMFRFLGLLGGNSMHTHFHFQVLALAFLLFSPFAAHAEALPEGVFTPAISMHSEWEFSNEPGNVNTSYIRNFASLPLEGSVDSQNIPWSEIYWPSNRGGINNRWNSRRPIGFYYTPPSRETALSMTQNQVAALSPSEKYDLYAGNYNYPTVHAVWGTESPRAPSWAGICDGWTAAATNYPEPHPITVTNPDGIVIPFGASDVKALLSYYYARFAKSKVSHLGMRCNSRYTNTANCSDVNAGAFHIVLANQIGLMKKAFIADQSRMSEVWNNPIYQFDSSIISRRRPVYWNAPGTVEQVLISTTVRYTNELAYPSWDAVGGTTRFRSFNAYYRYWLELNEAGEIIGGSWNSWQRPDFLWTRESEPFIEYYSKLNELLKR